MEKGNYMQTLFIVFFLSLLTTYGGPDYLQSCMHMYCFTEINELILYNFIFINWYL